ncbi:MAG: RHS repeat-associated core domain-containing protein [Flavobacteriales bacterium]|nr:RHS repeat-associated core domain-containing protein [Flavobacteriales bacterium]
MKTRAYFTNKTFLFLLTLIFGYQFNIHAQIHGDKLIIINNGNDDLFSEKVDYQKSSLHNSGVRFNGTICAVQWKNSESLTEAYSYDYDSKNQLLQADYYAKTGNHYINSSDFDVVGLHYDLNGNIESLKRYNPMGLIDDLQYTYDLNNQLDKVEETADLNQGYVSTQTINGYSYDDAGNVTRDNGRRVFIHYNHLNLPVIFAFDNLDTIKVIYDANGRKVQKITKKNDGSPMEHKYYVSGCEYSNDLLEAIYNEEGRAIESNNEFQYEYALKDHLGNNRVMFSDLNNDEKIDDNEVLQKNDYYPFGMNMQKNYSQIGTENSYQYNGKEMISDLGLNMLDYGARWYDPSIARWHTIDPLAEEFTAWSGYNYVMNNPISMTDPDGKAPLWKPYANEDGSVNYVSEEGDNYLSFVKQYGQEAADETFGSTCGECYDSDVTYGDGEMVLTGELHALKIYEKAGNGGIITGQLGGTTTVSNMQQVFNQFILMEEFDGITSGPININDFFDISHGAEGFSLVGQVETPRGQTTMSFDGLGDRNGGSELYFGNPKSSGSGKNIRSLTPLFDWNTDGYTPSFQFGLHGDYIEEYYRD